MQSEGHDGAGAYPDSGTGEKATGASRPGELSWTLVGAVSGAVGAAAVAVFFLFVDVAGRQALWTPAALGAALFLGERMAEEAAPNMALVVGYTAVHGAVFLSIGLMAAFSFVQRREPVGLVGGVTIAGVFFVVLELLILGFLHFASPGLVSTFGALKITMANLFASLVMAAFLTRMAGRVGGP